MVKPKRINPWMLYQGAFVPNWLLQREEIKPGAKILCALLASIQENEGTNELDFTELSARLGSSRRQIEFHLEELIQFGLVVVAKDRFELLDHDWVYTEPEDLDRHQEEAS